MPSFPFTPGALTLTGGEFNPEPIRFTFDAGLLRLTGGTFDIGATLSSSVDAALSAVLDTLFASEAIVDQEGRPTRRFQQLWENAIGGLKDALSNQGQSISELEAIYAGINTAQATATQAVQAAAATQSAVDLTNSYTDPVGVLTATSGGVVTVAAHTRIYGDGTTATVSGGTVSGFASGANVTIYYSDPARAGGAVSFQGTTEAVAQTGDRHIVGQVLIPAVGEADAAGAGPTAPGWKLPPEIEPDDLLAIGYAP